MTDSGQSVSAAQLADELHDRKASEKIRQAATLLAEAGMHLGNLEPQVDRRYECNQLYHDAILWLERWEPGR